MTTTLSYLERCVLLALDGGGALVYQPPRTLHVQHADGSVQVTGAGVARALVDRGLLAADLTITAAGRQAVRA